VFRARLWYLRQALSFISFASLRRVPAGSLLWAAIAAIAEYVFIFLVPRYFGLPLLLSLAALMTAALGIIGATAIQSNSDIAALSRASGLWGVLFAAMLTAAMAAGILAPVRAAVCLILILLTAGFLGAWRTDQVRMGTLTAIAAAFIGSALTAASLAVVSMEGLERPHPPIAGTFVLLSLGLGAALGSVGGMFGNGLKNMFRRQFR
ncbi:MAG TPA: hypothetical protein VFW83_04545, partial [Bryobacteraceae bacterium]|nr:hypothetical protein [Bryobacteraceae bacterium]